MAHLKLLLRKLTDDMAWVSGLGVDRQGKVWRGGAGQGVVMNLWQGMAWLGLARRGCIWIVRFY